jgi:hypothetical protein
MFVTGFIKVTVISWFLAHLGMPRMMLSTLTPGIKADNYRKLKVLFYTILMAK